MRKKFAVFTALVLGMTVFAVLNSSGPAFALPDHSLGGWVYICDNSQPLNGTIWEDSTPFAIWTNNTIVPPPGYQWTRYPQTGWYYTDKGYYSAVLPYADKNFNWSHGQEYRVEFNASALGYGITNATSNGTGSGKSTAGGVPTPPDGAPEYSDFGNTSNMIAYWEWGSPVQTDDFQQWDVIINCADLIPTQVMAGGQGPFSAPFNDPVTTVSVLVGQTVTLTSNVRNQGSTFVNEESTIVFWNQTGWWVTGHTAPVPANGNQVPVPNTATWPGSPSDGTFDLFITVDYPTVFTEYNAISGFLPPYGNITELDDTDVNVYPNTNNTVKIKVIVGNPLLPDLIPGNTPVPTDILFNNTAVTGGPPVSDTIIKSNNTWYEISSTVTNVGSGDAGPSNISFYNCSEFGVPQGLPFNITAIPALPAGTSSAPVTTMWLSPAGLGLDRWICIKVDYNDDVSEFEENNNTYIIHVYTAQGFPDLVPYDAITGLDIKINGGSYITPVTGNISITITTGQVIEVYSMPSNVGNLDSPAFDFGFFDNEPGQTTQAATPSYTFNVASLAIGTAYQTPIDEKYVKYYTQEGTYYIFLEVDYNAAVFEDDETNNILIIQVNVFDLPPPPMAELSADDINGNVSITWTNVTGEDVASYNIYWAESPEELNFTTPQATVVASGTSITYNHIAGVTEAPELYYVVCSVDVRGWEGPSSDIMGKFTIEIPSGYSTFSLPFEPFVINDAHWYLADMGLEQSDVMFSYDADHQKWIPHLLYLPQQVSNFDLVTGETYMLYSRAGQDQYTFVGYPGTTLRYIGDTINSDPNLVDPRIGVTQAFRDSLGATEDGDNIVLTWSWNNAWNRSAYESVGGFNIYRATSRGGFNFSDAPYATLSQVNFTWTDQNADGDEYYYLLVPVVGMTGREGSSALGIGVKRVTYDRSYNDFVLYLRPIGIVNSLHDHLMAMDLSGAEMASTIFWYDNLGKQRWIPHSAFMPKTISNPDTDIGQGGLIYLITIKDYTMIGR